MTIMMAMSLLLMISILCSVIEMTRVWGYNSVYKTSKELATTSLLASYDVAVWNNYHILSIPGGKKVGDELNIEPLEWRLLNYGNVPLKAGISSTSCLNLFTGHMWDAHITDYSVLTDQDGDVFRRQACCYAYSNLPATAIKSIVDYTKNQGTISIDEEGILAAGEEALAKAKEMEKEGEIKPPVEGDGTKKSGSYADLLGSNRYQLSIEDKEFEDDAKREEDTQLEEDPIEWYKAIKKVSILSLVLPRNQEVSSKYLKNRDTADEATEDEATEATEATEEGSMGSLESDLGERELVHGTINLVKEQSTNRLLYLSYLDDHFGSYNKLGGNPVLDYELEEILANKGNDEDNLKSVVRRLLLTREAVNFAYLAMCQEKKAIAGEIAFGMVGATGLVPLVEAVKWTILLAWAYVESILDVQDLMNKEKTPVIKSDKTWRTDIYHLGSALAQEEQTDKSNETKCSLSYHQYLLIYLYIMRDNTINMRTLRLMEENLEKSTGNRILLDQRVSAVRGTMSFEGQEVFANLITLPIEYNLNYKKELLFESYEY